MEFLKSKTQIFRPKTIISLNPLFYKKKEFLKEDDYKNQIINNYNYLNLKNTQSISTSIDDIKNNEFKNFCSTDNIVPVNILKNTIFIKESNCLNKLSINLFQKQINFKSSNENEKKFENKLILKIGKDKNSLNNNKNIIENNIKVKNVINPKNVNTFSFVNKDFNDNKINKSIRNVIRTKKNEESKIFQEDTIKNKNNILIKKEVLSSFPPKISLLYNHKYLLEYNTKNIFLNNNSYKKINRSVIPNIFYNHIMIKNNKAKIRKISTTNRIKGKLLTIVYFIPI